jgi:beta-glucosidase
MYDRKPTEEIREVFNDDIHTGYNPLFEFGYGLSYTSFAYSDLKLSSNELVGDNNLTITVNVKNTGVRDGKHTVELYTRDMYASITPNMKRLRAFQKVDLKAGESKTVTFTINKDDLAFVNAQLKTLTEAGDFKIMVGKLSADFKYK